MCGKTLKEEFQLSKFCFEGEKRSVLFGTYVKGVSRWIRLAIQGTFAVYLIFMMFISMIRTTKRKHNDIWFHYMTSWAYMLTVVYFIFAFVKLALNKPKRTENKDEETGDEKEENEKDLMLPSENEHEKMNKSDKIFWLLFEIVLTTNLIVVLVYWTILFKPKSSWTAFGYFLTADRHGISLLLFLIEFSFHTIPIRILHFVYMFIFALVFFVHTYIYYAITGRIVYVIFDWSKPVTSLLYFMGVLLVATVVHLLTFGIDSLKHYLNRGKK